MAVSNKNASNNRQQVRRTDSDSFRWIVGLLLALIGFFAASAVFFSYFDWSADQSGLNLSAEERETLGVTPENPCGWTGARLGTMLVDRSFGVFGILLPVLLIVIGVRIIRKRPLLSNRYLLPLLLVTLLGSLTLGVAFGTRWSLCASTGWGGAFGIGVADLLRMRIGFFGTIIVLVGGWILTGVFINRNFIDTVNEAGRSVADRSERIVGRMWHRGGAEQSDAENEADEEPFADEEEQPAAPVAPAAPPVRPNPRPVPPTPVAAAEPAVEVPAEHPVPPQPTADSPFELIGGADEPAEAPAAPAPATPAVEKDSPFEVVDVSSGSRIVLGPSGLVELAQPAAPAPKAPAPLPAEGPFTEIDLAKLVESETPDAPAAPAPQPTSAPEPLPTPSEPFTVVPQPEPEGLVITVETPEDEEQIETKKIPTEAYDPTKDLLTYRMPPVTLLEDYQSGSGEVSSEEIFENKAKIEETLANFGIPIQKIKATVGPTVTLYEIVQAQGVKISKIQNLGQDIAQSLKALGIRIIAPIPGKGTIGIEVPNRDKKIVSMFSAVRSKSFFESKAELPVVIGRTIQNENYVFDLAKMPHLLVAGSTGTGKSVGLNAIITSLLYRKHPSQLKLVMIDPKMVEFSLYAKLERHFLAKMESEDRAIITDPMKAVYTLNSLCVEMDSRLEMLSLAGSRNIVEFNEKFTARRLNPEKGFRYLPYIVVVIDEFADLIMMAKEVERPVMRLAQKARAVGIHLIVATQRPDVKVITGGIKANFPARIAFRVSQMIDSRTILDRPGAEQLIGRGDMLFSKDSDMTRIQCALVETAEVERIVDYIAKQQGYLSAYSLPDYQPEGSGEEALGSDEADMAPKRYDALFAEIARDAVQSGSISTSMIQRNYEVGFNRAGRIMMQLERAGIVGRQQGAKPRDILFHDSQSLEAKLQDLGLF